MESLGADDFRKILEIAEVAHAASGWDALGRDVLAAVGEAVCAEKAVFMLQEAVGAPLRFFYMGIGQVDADRYLASYYLQDPMCLLSKVAEHLEVSCQAIGRTVSLTEMVARDDFLRTPYYREFYRPQGVLHEIATRLESWGGVRGVLDLLRSERAPAFSVREVQLMNCLVPHLSSALDGVRARELQRREGAREHRGVLLCHRDGRVAYADDLGRKLLRALTGGEALLPLPHSAREGPGVSLLTAARKSATAFAAREHAPHWEVVTASGRYHLACSPAKSVDESHEEILLAVSISCSKESAVDLRANLKHLLGITCREADIVFKLFEAKTNGEIAQELFVSELTVKKHIQHICDKMGVRSRTAILSKAYCTLGNSLPRSHLEALPAVFS
ncbi:MAG: helix-turn-helix transcriptional regulator [Deltaproteobacteria bacterium]|nr:helix-turn-helix transcriptional regulator [Deltaproteobacteria bacterium]